MRKLTAIIFGLLYVSVSLLAQERYASSRLERLSHYADSSDKGLSIYSEKENGIVRNIGLNIIPEEVMRQWGKDVCGFINRYLLEIECLGDEAKENQVIISGDWHIIGNETILKLNLRENGRYFFEAANEGREELFTMDFPASYSLISGKTKIELENSFREESFVDCQVEPYKLNPARLKNEGNGLFSENDGYHIVPRVRNLRYFMFYNGEFVPFCDSSNPEASIYSMLTGTVRDRFYYADVTLLKYGYIKEEFSIPLLQLIDAWISRGCKPYVGLGQAKDGKLESVVFLVNRALGYVHLLKTAVDIDLLSRMNGKLDVEIHAYIPIYPDSNQSI